MSDEEPEDESVEPANDVDDGQPDASASVTPSDPGGNTYQTQSATATCGFQRSAGLISKSTQADASTKDERNPKKRPRGGKNVAAKIRMEGAHFR